VVRKARDDNPVPELQPRPPATGEPEAGFRPIGSGGLKTPPTPFVRLEKAGRVA
jgi:hypothetical protein